jgi:hypothetical protein
MTANSWIDATALNSSNDYNHLNIICNMLPKLKKFIPNGKQEKLLFWVGLEKEVFMVNCIKAY